MLDLKTYTRKLEEAVAHYEKSAPAVSDHCNDLYIRINESPKLVSLYELKQIETLWHEGWEGPNYAANRIYKLRYYLKMETTGQIDF